VAAAGAAVPDRFLVCPTIGTIIQLQNTAGTKFVGLDNFVYSLSSPTPSAPEEQLCGSSA
jgi:hypothetical protein